MAGLTTVGGGDVIARFTRRIVAVVARNTVTGHTTVIESGPSKRIGIVAIVTGIAALDMVRRFARRGAAVVTANATSLNFGVIHTTHR